MMIGRCSGWMARRNENCGSSCAEYLGFELALHTQAPTDYAAHKMTKWILAAILFATFGITFVIEVFSSASEVNTHGVQFLTAPTARRLGFTTADRTGSMVFAAFISGLGCLGSAFAAVNSRRRGEADDSELNEKTESDTWTCPHCHEKNPGNFEECWKCERLRDENSA
jgi:hypothetical protein